MNGQPRCPGERSEAHPTRVRLNALLRRLYYHLKPGIPWSVRIAARRLWAARQRKRHRASWPINEVAGNPPEGWPGWPDGKQFAFVLTHDVEGQEGLEKVQSLAELELSLGFRSSFNLVPENNCCVPDELRHWLTGHGFEVGVHDLHHDGSLFASRKAFRRQAVKINHYLKNWNAVGFRSGFMFHHLDWTQDLNVLYDASTFDTDPFEPQPDASSTIFPFWVPNPQSSKLDVGGSMLSVASNSFASCDPEPHPSTLNPQPVGHNSQPGASSPPSSFILHPSSLRRNGYIELPYTLVQDFNLFIILQEQSIDIWKQKLDWIVSKGGMALMDVHPDYMAFGGESPLRHEYPATLYGEFLKWAKEKYGPQYWHALPRDVAAYCRQEVRGTRNHAQAKPCYHACALCSDRHCEKELAVAQL
jgi:hypothetical protein